METAREVLNEYKWRKDRELDQIEIYYIHRGAPGDSMVLRGDHIRRLDQLFFHTDEDTIPYHRIYKMTYKGRTIWQRPFKGPEPKTGTEAEMHH